MAPKTLFAVIASLAIVGAVFFREASAQTSGCTASILSLASCLGYITGVEATPSSSCCGGLASVVKTSPQCLCQVLNGGATQFGITVNQTQALQLPGACNVVTPPVSECNAASAPAAPTTPSTNNTASPSPPQGGSSPAPPGGVGTQSPPNKASGNAPFSVGLVFLLVGAVAGLVSV